MDVWWQACLQNVNLQASSFGITSVEKDVADSARTRWQDRKRISQL
jgi:hypothetical protein